MASIPLTVVVSIARKSIYIASKTKHAPLWRELRAQGVPIISSWIDEAEKGQTQSFEQLWTRCTREATMAHFLIVFRGRGDDCMHGACLEVGAAIATNVPVLWVGEPLSLTRHPRIWRCKSMTQALTIAGVI